MRKSVVFVLLFFLAACGEDSETTQLTIFAASSLTDAYTEIATAFEAQYPDTSVVLSFAGSSTLATQIIDGANADIFASANQNQMQNIQDESLTAGEPVIFAANQVVIILPIENTANINGLEDLIEPGIKIVLASPGVPIRDYTEIMLEQISAHSNFIPTYADQFLQNVVSEEDNVRQVLLKIALDEADAGVVYRSDALLNAEDVTVSVLELPEQFNVSALYPMTILRTSDHPENAQQFVDFVLSDAGQQILERWGFMPFTQES